MALEAAARRSVYERGLVYSTYGETLFVKIMTEDGAVGWGETHASVAPEVGATIVETLLAPLLLGRDPMPIEALWADLFGAMRDQGHRGQDGVEQVTAAILAFAQGGGVQVGTEGCQRGVLRWGLHTPQGAA